MTLRVRHLLLFLLFIAVFGSHVTAENEQETPKRVRTAPLRNTETGVIDGSGVEHAIGSDRDSNLLGVWKGGNSRVSVSTVAIFTLAMAAATGLGAVPFFFVELDPQWSGICNGMAAGVMLAASFDLIQEGQDHGSGNWVVVGILAGGIFIWLCKKGAFFVNIIILVVITVPHGYQQFNSAAIAFSLVWYACTHVTGRVCLQN